MLAGSAAIASGISPTHAQEPSMIKTVFTACLLSLSLLSGQAFAANAACEAKAIDKNGKALAGAAKTSFMKKCEADAKGGSACETKAVDKNGKPLAGAAKNSFMKKCESESPKP
jgi:opacity protein-like surface antigen